MATRDTSKGNLTKCIPGAPPLACTEQRQNTNKFRLYVYMRPITHLKSLFIRLTRAVAGGCLQAMYHNAVWFLSLLGALCDRSCNGRKNATRKGGLLPAESS